MADGTAATNLKDPASPTKPPALAQRLSSEAALDTLQLILLGAPLTEVLTSVTRLIEAHGQGMLCSICLLDEDGAHLRYVAANLPEAYRAATDGMRIGPNVGSCGAAAYLGTPVFVSDMVSHPNWATFRDVVLQSGLRAAWSTPIMSHDGKVQGTFCLYDSEVRDPGPQERQLIDYAGRVARIAIERNRSPSALTVAFETTTTNEQNLRLIVDCIPGFVSTFNAAGEVQLHNRQVLEYAGKTAEEMTNWATSDLVHPDDLPRVIDAWRRAIEIGGPIDLEHRSRGADGVYRWFHARARPQRDAEGRIVGWYNLGTDIDERKRAEGELERAFDEIAKSEAELRTIVDAIPQLIVALGADGQFLSANQAVLEYTGLTREELRSQRFRDVFHLEDTERLRDVRDAAISRALPFEYERRVRHRDGQYRWLLVQYNPLRNERGEVIRWYATGTDIDQRKRAEDTLRSNEQSLRLILDSIPGFVSTFNATGEVELQNRQVLEYTGKTAEEMTHWATSEVLHPDDLPRVIDAWRRAIAIGGPIDLEHRSRGADGVYRWFHARARPQRDAEGRIVRWYNLVTDVDERKRAESELARAFEEIKRLKDRLHDENVVLKQQIDQVSMFEEIVGSAPALKTVLSSMMRVAPTDSTVLITGETGTGKELIARAIHKSSQRAGQPFVSVNCAAIPSSLIASELFGHEKGAFTGALQRRQGRFELAHPGTLFLDEVGELPAETQIALLRVLQERQFERVGSNRVIRVDVRIIAATNLDLTTAITSGDFRSDLFYRLNVFPIAVPPLRERKEDIPMLIEYFVKRYAEKARKTIRKIDKSTFKLCQSYSWPGNIRELQNIIERSVILCTGDTFWIDEGWLSSSNAPHPESSGPLTANLRSYEKQLIESALAESNGRVAGRDGAAAKLGIPRSTLDARIKQLKITKYSVR
jgi:PAS domain S-box-containing protein